MIRQLALASAAAFALVLAGCGGDDDSTDEEPTEVSVDGVDQDDDGQVEVSDAQPLEADDTAAESPQAVLTTEMTWHWQLQGDIDTGVDADVYDIDLFDTAPALIDDLHADGRIVICYFSTAWEDWRDDAESFPAAALGAPLDDWEGERWVDITDPSVRDLLAARLDLAVSKGCDGVEPDNITAYRNDTGFDLSADDQLEFNRFLANESRSRGLLVGLKNDLEQIPDLVGDFDFAVNEQCVQYDECEVYEPFVSAGKVVFGAEYSDDARQDPDAACRAAAAADVRMVVLPVELDGSFRIPCPG